MIERKANVTRQGEKLLDSFFNTVEHDAFQVGRLVLCKTWREDTPDSMFMSIFICSQPFFQEKI